MNRSDNENSNGQDGSLRAPLVSRKMFVTNSRHEAKEIGRAPLRGNTRQLTDIQLRTGVTYFAARVTKNNNRKERHRKNKKRAEINKRATDTTEKKAPSEGGEGMGKGAPCFANTDMLRSALSLPRRRNFFSVLIPVPFINFVLGDFVQRKLEIVAKI